MSIYNHIAVTGEGPDARINVDCHPDQFTRDRVSLDQADYRAIKAAARMMGWEQDRLGPQLQRMKLLAADLVAALDAL